MKAKTKQKAILLEKVQLGMSLGEAAKQVGVSYPTGRAWCLKACMKWTRQRKGPPAKAPDEIRFKPEPKGSLPPKTMAPIRRFVALMDQLERRGQVGSAFLGEEWEILVAAKNALIEKGGF